MINLIPPDGQKVLKTEYVLRVGATFGILFGVVLLLVVVAHIPTYVLVDAQIKSLDTSMVQYNNEREDTRELDEEVKRAKTITAQLGVTDDTISATALLTELQRVMPNAITLKSFAMQTDDKGDATVQVQGIAPTREALAAFKVAVENSEMFAEAQIPISDLAKDTDLPFAVTITLEPET
jgi:Tfp pilus assembly protein PilN